MKHFLYNVKIRQKRKKIFDRSWGLVFKHPKVWRGHLAGSAGNRGYDRGIGGTSYPSLGLGISGGSISSRALN